MIITKIKIDNVKGISSREISCRLYPNKTSIFVAPNGFGKTSFATAFKSLKKSRIELDDDDFHKGDLSKKPAIELTDEYGNIYAATTSSNSLSSTFDATVITSRIKAKASSHNMGTFTATSSSLAIEPIVLYSSIPEKVDFQYSFRGMQSEFGAKCSKLLLNLKKNLSDYDFIQKFIEQKSNFDKILRTRNHIAIQECISAINQLSGITKPDIIRNLDISAILAIAAVNDVNKCIGQFWDDISEQEKIINIIQLAKAYNDNKSSISKISKYKTYVQHKKSISELISFFNSTWKNIKASERKSKLIIDFPKAKHISNGERDILCFIGKLFEFSTKIERQNKAILIIDEVFDYLDDANLIAAQYFLTTFIEKYKENGKEIYPIILTHLDPIFFNTFIFSSINVVYLDTHVQASNKYNINSILKERKNCKKKNKEIYDSISSHFLHYSPHEKEQSEYLDSIGVEKRIHNSSQFRRIAFKELEAYQNKETYDLAFVCCGLRLLIEKIAFDQINESNKAIFLETKKTIDKLFFAKKNGAEIPEAHFLLSIIYNEAMHLDSQCQKLQPIAYKLKNKVIHHMIKQVKIPEES